MESVEELLERLRGRYSRVDVLLAVDVIGILLNKAARFKMEADRLKGENERLRRWVPFEIDSGGVRVVGEVRPGSLKVG